MTMTVRKSLTMGLIFLLQVTGMAAEDGNEPSVARIKVRIWDRVPIESETLNRAKTITEGLYQHGGIAITWVHCSTEPIPENLVCACPKRFNDISVRIFPRARDVYPKTGYYGAGSPFHWSLTVPAALFFFYTTDLKRWQKLGTSPWNSF
jgi:hypothetical protein